MNEAIWTGQDKCQMITFVSLLNSDVEKQDEGRNATFIVS
jgi:hypothetical protein